VPSIVITFFITLLGWVLFRADNIHLAWDYLCNMFSFNFVADEVYFDTKFYFILLVAVFFSFWGGFKKIEMWQQKLFAKDKRLKAILSMFVISIILFMISLASITSTGFNPFIYFRF